MRVRSTFAILTAAALFWSAPASARTFFVVRSGPDAWTVMDAEGIEQVPETTIRKAWSVTVQRNILSAGLPPQPGYVRTLNEYDCEAGRVRWMTFSAYSRGGGLLVTRENPAPEWGPADEAEDILAGFRVVCRGAGGGTVVAADSLAKVVIGLMSAWDQPPPAPPEKAQAQKTRAKPTPSKPQSKKQS